MNPLQMEPPRQPQKRQGGLTPSRWLQHNISTPPDEAITSLGEFLLPTLLGAMDACWIAAALIGLAATGIFGASEPLLPFWAPFIFLTGTQWLFYFMDRSGQKAWHERLYITLAALLCIFIIWLQVYANSAGLFDPHWLATLFSDILFLNSHFFEVVFIVALSFILSWRGLRLSGRIVEPSIIFRTLCLGIVVMIVVTVLRAQLASGGAALHDDALLFLLIPLFLYLSLAAHSLARIAFVRRTHTTGLQGSIVAQERAVITVMGLIGAVLLVITIIIAIFAGPAFFTSALHTLAPVGAAIGNAYNWLVGIIANVAVFLATPFFWLFSLLSNLVPKKAQNRPKLTSAFGKPKKPVTVSLANSPALLLVLKILLPIVILLALILLVRLALRRRRKTRTRSRLHDEDFHESLWSWSLFWSQLRAILRSLFRRFLPQPSTEGEAQTAPVVEPADPAARDIRAIYRAFLKKAAARGYARKKDETPDELRHRLDEKTPLVEPQLEAITEAYTMVRYGESLPDASDVTYIRGQWSELDQKWV